MPQMSFVMALATTAALLSACNSAVTVTPNGAMTNSMMQSGAQNSTDAAGLTLPNFNFVLARGGNFSVSLSGNPTTGYLWHLVNYDAKIVMQVAPNTPGTYSRLSNQGNSGLLGAPSTEIFDFKALASGTTTLVFAQYRPWEGPASATDNRTFTATVQ